MITVENLTKSFCDQDLFEDISFKINQKERVGLTGKNGHGKTTLFKILTGSEHADSGKITIPRGYRIGYVEQELKFTQPSILEEAVMGLPNRSIEHHWKAEKILAGLGFSDLDIQKKPKDLSGGFQVRLNLSKVLLSDPDMLLLDEPNNYLDITSIRWLSKFLLNWKSELILITHDRSFMDSVVTHTMGIHRKKIYKIPGNTEKLYNQIAKQEEVYEKTRVNDEKKKKEIAIFISRFRAKARLAGMVQSRLKTMSKMRDLDKLEKIQQLDFSFTYKPFKAKYSLSSKGLTFSYRTDTDLINDFNITIGAQDRICIIGQNGKGKTTLLKILANCLKPSLGEVTYHPETIVGYYEQSNVKNLEDSRTVLDELMIANTNIDQQKARDICATMMFERENALKKVKILSGGEKSRVLLGKILCTPVNLLLLDEPTNHLDMHSCDALLSALDLFEGAIIMVTHNEMFLHAIANRLIIFKDNQILIQENDYQTFLNNNGWNDEINETKITNSLRTETKLSKKEIRKKRSEIINERAKTIKPLEKSILETENEIEKKESELELLNNEIIKASNMQDSILIQKHSKTIHSLKERINALFITLEKLIEELEEKEGLYKEKMSELDFQEKNN